MKKFFSKRVNKKGMTLVELIVAIGVFMIVISAVLVTISVSYRTTASATKSDRNSSEVRQFLAEIVQRGTEPADIQEIRDLRIQNDITVDFSQEEIVIGTTLTVPGYYITASSARGGQTVTFTEIISQEQYDAWLNRI